MFRRLTAIEIAEGALLADIAIVFRFVATFLPGSASFLTLLNFTVFTVLVLRRGLYVALMGSCVAVFLMCVLLGPHALSNMAMESLGGMFLGFAMRRRWSTLTITIVGAILGALFLYCLVFLVGVLTGVTANDYLQSLRHSINLALSFLSVLMPKLGLGASWQQLHPQILSAISLFLTYWYLTFYGALVVILCPFVLMFYMIVNSLVRIMGYDVRLSPAAKLKRRIRRFRRRVVRLLLQRRQASRERSRRERVRWRKVA